MLDDPYLKLGYGMHSYFKVMKYLMLMAVILTLLFSAPLMYIYAEHSDLKYDDSAYMWNQYSLGNLGGSEAICKVNSISANIPMTLSCTTGVIDFETRSDKTGKRIFDAGIVPISQPVSTICSREAFNDLEECSKHVDKDILLRHIEKDCAG